MKKIIYDYDFKKRIIYVIDNNKKIALYLTNGLSKLFGKHLSKGVLIDVVLTKKRRMVGLIPTQQVDYFIKIENLNPKRVVYDFKKLQDDMYEVLTNNEYYLFLDFEMSMPSYQKSKSFEPQIIQVGYVLSKPFEEPIKKNGYYIKLKQYEPLSARTLKFLNITQSQYDEESYPFIVFHKDLKSIINKYQPKIVVWGKTDQHVLFKSYQKYRFKPYLNNFDFINLLKLHKDYYNLDNDLGLFKAFKKYYQVDYQQEHDATTDALITKYVFEGFINNMKKNKEVIEK